MGSSLSFLPALLPTSFISSCPWMSLRRSLAKQICWSQEGQQRLLLNDNSHKCENSQVLQWHAGESHAGICTVQLVVLSPTDSIRLSATACSRSLLGRGPGVMELLGQVSHTAATAHNRGPGWKSSASNKKYVGKLQSKELAKFPFWSELHFCWLLLLADWIREKMSLFAAIQAYGLCIQSRERREVCLHMTASKCRTRCTNEAAGLCPVSWPSLIRDYACFPLGARWTQVLQRWKAGTAGIEKDSVVSDLQENPGRSDSRSVPVLQRPAGTALRLLLLSAALGHCSPTVSTAAFLCLHVSCHFWICKCFLYISDVYLCSKAAFLLGSVYITGTVPDFLCSITFRVK